MNFRHLQICLAICETGSMTRAAHDLYRTQPSVSQAIAELESEYGNPRHAALLGGLFTHP